MVDNRIICTAASLVPLQLSMLLIEGGAVFDWPTIDYSGGRVGLWERNICRISVGYFSTEFGVQITLSIEAKSNCERHFEAEIHRFVRSNDANAPNGRTEVLKQRRSMRRTRDVYLAQLINRNYQLL